jgi:alpha-L-fucosidase
LIYRYEFYTSNDGENWTKQAVPGEFGNIQFNPLQQFVTFNNPTTCRYVKFVPTATVNGDTTYIIADFALLK